jgi:replicative DNA helicase
MREKDNFELSNNIDKEITELVMYIIFSVEKVFQEQDNEVLKEITSIDFKYIPSNFLKDLILEIVKLQLNNINIIEVLNVKNLKKKIDEIKEKTKDDFNYYHNSFSQERVKEIKKKLETFYYCKKVLNLFNQDNKNIMLDFKNNILEIANEIQVNTEVADENAELREIPKLVDEAHKTENTRILTNTPLDHFLYFEKKEVNTIIAETGLGKTAFVLDLALRLTNNNYKGIFFSCEMDLVKLGHRIIANQLQVPLTLIQNKRTYEKIIEREDIKKEIEKIEERKNLKLYNGTFTINKIESYIKKFKLAQENIDFIVIDYLQLLNLDEKGGTTYEKTSEISKRLKQIAKDNNICIFCISQLSRAYQERRERLKKGEKFYLSVTDIKDSSQIEMDASIIIGLVAESIEKDALGEKKLVNLQILKNRLGTIGTDYYVEFLTQTQKINYARLEKLFNKVKQQEEAEEVEEIEEQQRMF